MGRILSETYSIQDCSFYDASSQLNLSKYTANTGATISYDSTNEAYALTKIQTTDGAFIGLDSSYTFYNTSKIMVDLKIASNTNNQQLRMGLFNGDNGVTGMAVKTNVDASINCASQTKTSYGTSLGSQLNLSISQNVWYVLIVEFTSSSVTVTLKQGDTTLGTLTYSQSTLASTGNTLGFFIGHFVNSQMLIKNITVL